MFDLLENEELDQWFQRFSAPLKHLPIEERAELHQEVRQHLEALVAANEELGSSPQEAWEHALAQFGDPAHIGRRLAWEWRRSQGWVSPDMAAVLYTLGAHVVSTAVLIVCTVLVMITFRLYDNFGTAFTLEYLVGVPLLAGAAVGRRFPNRALTGAFYAAVAWPLLPLMVVAAVSMTRLNVPDLLSVMLWPAGWLTLGCGAAYLASARQRRQWYRPTLADFMLRLPRRWAAPSPREEPSLWV